MSWTFDRKVMPFGAGVVLAGLTLASSGWAQNPPPAAPPPTPPAAPAKPAPAKPAPAKPAPAKPAEAEPPAPKAPAAATAPAAEAPPTAAPEATPEAPGTEAEASEPPSAEATPEEAAPSEAPAADDTVVESGSGLFEDASSGGGEVADESAAGGGAASKTFDLNGYVRGDVFVGKVEGAGDGEIKAAYGELALQLRTARQTYGDGFAEARVRYGEQTEVRDLSVDLREAYVNAYLGPLDLRLGQQVIVWGRADAFNPTNNLTPFDLRVHSPAEDDRRLANVGARAFLTFEPVRLEGAWMPLYRASELPPFELDPYITIVENYPRPTLQSGLFAGRLHLLFSSFETSVSYLNGYNTLPGYRWTQINWGENAGVIVERKPYRHQVFGFDFSTALGDFMGVRGEAAYRLPDDYENKQNAPRPDVQYVLGLDKTFGQVSVIAQYLGRYTLDWQREPGASGIRSLSELADYTDLQAAGPQVAGEVEDELDAELPKRNQMIFQQLEEVQHMVSLRLEWLALHETLSLSALGLVNLSTEEWMVFPKLAYQLSDSMSATIGGEIYAGPTGTLLGLIDEKLSAGYTELRFSY